MPSLEDVLLKDFMYEQNPNGSYIIDNYKLVPVNRDNAVDVILQAEKGKINDTEYNELVKYEDYGFKVDSQNPYIHRRIASIFYWFSILKPFNIDVLHGFKRNDLGFIISCYNEFTTYMLASMVLKSFNQELNFGKGKIMRSILYDLHFRNLSRSSLEFFLHTHIVDIKTSAIRPPTS
ncbi:hypothetical protein AGMMS50268_09670 [Spirochaetia bacterium]|nr:hypothetical protein AGMMS50268_09670 [Spirochaetia bacterium]